MVLHGRQSRRPRALVLQRADPHPGCLDLGGSLGADAFRHCRADPARDRLVRVDDGLSLWRGSSAMKPEHLARLLGLALLSGSLLCLAGCNDGSGDPNAEIGANPKLPDLQQYLLPPMHI